MPDVSAPNVARHDLDLERARIRLTHRQRLAIDLHYYLGLRISDITGGDGVRGRHGQVDTRRRAIATAE